MEKVLLDILIVDDDVEILESLKKSLERIGYNCQIINNAEDALKIYKKRKFDVVLTDIQLPEMNGVELIQHLYHYNKNVKIIVITVLQDFELIGNEAVKNIYGYFDKPINFFSLAEKLEKIELKVKKYNK
jgi:two-component system response regulator YesN